MFKRKLMALSYIVVLLGFTGYVLMDTFFIEKSYQSVAVTNINETTVSLDADEISSNQEEIDDPSTTEVTVVTYEDYDSTIYVADVILGEGDYIYTALAENTYGSNITETTSSIADSVGAKLAVNGDFYGVQNAGYVIRNGEILRDVPKSDSQEDLVFYKDGTMEIIEEGDYTAAELVEDGATNVLSFGPGLVEDDEIAVNEGDEVSKAKSTTKPRTAVGYISENHYVFVTVDGRTEESEGISLYNLAQFMVDIGCTQAYNLDGGGSTTMYYQGEVINLPTTSGRKIEEREVSDIVFIY